MPYWLAAADRDCDWTDGSVAADASPALGPASNWLVVESAMDTAGPCHRPAHLAAVDLLLRQRHLLGLPEAAGSVASYYDSGWVAGTAVAESSAAVNAAVADPAAAVAVAADWTVDFVAAVVVAESVDFVTPRLSLRNPYGEADSLVVESVLNYSCHQNSKGFSAADHWDPACVTGVGFPSCMPQRLPLIVDWCSGLLGTAARLLHLPVPAVNSKTAMRWHSSVVAVAAVGHWKEFVPRGHRTYRQLPPECHNFV